MWGSWTPHKVKMAVSGCPRNCAEATCKDVGVICVDSGYEVSVGGAAAGMDVKETDPARQGRPRRRRCSTLSPPSSNSIARHAKYLDRPYKWVAKVGLDWVKERVVDDLDSRGTPPAGRPLRPSRRRSTRPILGRNGRRPKTARRSSSPIADSDAGGGGMNAAARTWVDVGRVRGHPHPRRPRGEAPMAAASPCSALRTDRGLRASTTRCPHKKAVPCRTASCMARRSPARCTIG